MRFLPTDGFSVAFPPADCDVFQEDVLIAQLKDVEAVLAGSEPYTQRVIDSLPKLRAIVRAGVGFDAVDLAACDEAGIPVCTTPGVNHHSVAEHTIALLDGDRPRLSRARPQGSTKPLGPRRLSAGDGQNAGDPGAGADRPGVATRAVGLGMKVLALEPYPDQAFVKKWNIELVDLDTMLARSDFVSLHLPMSRENQHLINRERFAKMKKGAMLVNTARGPLVNEADLCEALEDAACRRGGARRVRGRAACRSTARF